MAKDTLGCPYLARQSLFQYRTLLLIYSGPGPRSPQSISPQEQMPQTPPNLKIFLDHMQNCIDRREKNFTKFPKFSIEVSNLD